MVKRIIIFAMVVLGLFGSTIFSGQVEVSGMVRSVYMTTGSERITFEVPGITAYPGITYLNEGMFNIFKADFGNDAIQFNRIFAMLSSARTNRQRVIFNIDPNKYTDYWTSYNPHRHFTVCTGISICGPGY